MLRSPLSGALGTDWHRGGRGGLLAVFTVPGVSVGTAPVVKRAAGTRAAEGVNLLLRI